MWYLSGMNVMHYGSMNYCISLTQVFCPIPWDQFIPDGHLLTFHTTKSNTTTRMKSFKSSGIHCFLFVSREYTSAYCLVSLLIRRWRLVSIKWQNWIPYTVGINVVSSSQTCNYKILRWYIIVLFLFREKLLPWPHMKITIEFCLPNVCLVSMNWWTPTIFS